MREVPEALKPRKVSIGQGQPSALLSQQIAANSDAAVLQAVAP